MVMAAAALVQEQGPAGGAQGFADTKRLGIQAFAEAETKNVFFLACF